MDTKIHPLWPRFTYFSHQLSGIRWMLDKERNGTTVRDDDGDEVTVYGGFQCDDMGLGKTIQILATMVNHPQAATLLVAPLAMIETWSAICLRAGLIVYEVDPVNYGMPWKKMNDEDDAGMMGCGPGRTGDGRPAVYLTNYEKLYMRPSLFRRPWNRVVLDEAHKIRNGDSEVAHATRKLQAPLRWAVTGTPLVNSLKDVVSLMAFVGVPCDTNWRWELRFRTLFPQITIHRSLKALRSSIVGAPPVPVIHNMLLPFVSAEEDEFYQGVQGATESLLEKYSGDAMNHTEIFKLLLRLRQLSVHPQVFINAKRREDSDYARKDWVAESTKLKCIQEILLSDAVQREVSDAPHKYILFCQFNDEMALLRDFLLKEGLVQDENILMYHGGLNQSERTAVLKRSKETTETTVLLLQIQAGGVGLNLQEYDRIIFVSPWWTAALMDQAVARAVRMGQTKVVHVYHLQLQAEKDNTINIDRLVKNKADEKRVMLETLFALCNVV
jgi:SNF2 family DNA or RNA helicase